MDEYNRFKLNYVITPEAMNKAKESMILMHPLPRVGEIDPAVDADPRSAFFRQVSSGERIIISSFDVMKLFSNVHRWKTACM